MLLLVPMLCSAQVFASNIYNIEYSGGVPLNSENVTVDPSLSTLSPIYKNNDSVSLSDSSMWEQGYLLLGGSCNKYAFVRFDENNSISSSSNLYYILSSQDYDVKVQINKIVVDGVVSSDVGVSTNGAISVGRGGRIYSDSECTVKYDESMSVFSLTNHAHIFVETKITVFKHNTSEIFTSDELFFGLIDIDSAQSFKILNSGSLLSEDNMFAMPEPDGEFDERNKFVREGNYIYSDYSNGPFDNQNETNNIFVKVDVESQRQGLDVVFGFSVEALSRIIYYAKQYTVNYISDEGGEIVGITTEDVFAGHNATGSTVSSKKGFSFIKWVADKDIVLDDGTIIRAGDPILKEQLLHVVVNEDLVFTALHEPLEEVSVAYKSDTNGEIIGINNETVEYEGYPSGSESKPDDNYVFDYWVSNIDVVLDDGTVIHAGEPISPDQLLRIVIDHDIVFIAIHSPAIAVPDTGFSHNEGCSTVGSFVFTIFAVLLLSILSIAILIFLIKSKSHIVISL